MTSDDKIISRIYQKTSRTEPPSQLDDAILNASRQALDNKARARGPFSGSWPVPVSMVAVVVVAVILIPVVMHESEPDKNAPGSIDTVAPAQSVTENKSHTAEKLEDLQFNKLDQIRAPTAKRMQSLPSDGSTASPAAPSSYSDYEEDALSSEPVPARLNKPIESAQEFREKKAAISQGFMKSESKERLRSPEEWEAYIKELLVTNEADRAKLETKALKLAYPDYNIDPELNKLLD